MVDVTTLRKLFPISIYNVKNVSFHNNCFSLLSAYMTTATPLYLPVNTNSEIVSKKLFTFDLNWQSLVKKVFLPFYGIKHVMTDHRRARL